MPKQKSSLSCKVLSNLAQAVPDLLWNVIIASALQLNFGWSWGRGRKKSWKFFTHLIHASVMCFIIRSSEDEKKGWKYLQQKLVSQFFSLSPRTGFGFARTKSRPWMVTFEFRIFCFRKRLLVCGVFIKGRKDEEVHRSASLKIYPASERFIQSFKKALGFVETKNLSKTSEGGKGFCG